MGVRKMTDAINPIVSVNTEISEFRIVLDFYSRITFVAGDSGVGKSFLYEQLSLLSTDPEFKYIKCFNYLSPDLETHVALTAKNAENLIVIDNFETHWSQKLAHTILTSPAKFMIISRDFFGLMQSAYGVAKLDVADNHIGLTYPMASGVACDGRHFIV
jgi:hypothetical protein